MFGNSICQGENIFYTRFLLLMYLFMQASSCTDNEFECRNSVMPICSKSGYWVLVECPENAICKRDAGSIFCSIRPRRARNKKTVLVDSAIKSRLAIPQAFNNQLNPGMESNDIEASYGDRTRRNAETFTEIKLLKRKQDGISDTERLNQKLSKPQITVTSQADNYRLSTPFSSSSNPLVYSETVNDPLTTWKPYITPQSTQNVFSKMLEGASTIIGSLEQPDSILELSMLQPHSSELSSIPSSQKPDDLDTFHNFFDASETGILSPTGEIVTAAQLTNALKTQGYSPNENYLNAVVHGTNKYFKNRETAAMFLAQIAYESGGYVHIEEIACKNSGCPEIYGRGAPGKSYHGRGFIQLSWPGNYRSASRDLGMGDKLYENLLG